MPLRQARFAIYEPLSPIAPSLLYALERCLFRHAAPPASCRCRRARRYAMASPNAFARRRCGVFHAAVTLPGGDAPSADRHFQMRHRRISIRFSLPTAAIAGR
jgi:hypothetical protein